MTASGIHLFKTTLGPCGLAWTERGIAGVQLPVRDEAATLERLRARFPGFETLPVRGQVKTARDRIVTLLKGQAQDFSELVLDMTGVTAFRQGVYRATRAIPRGQTLSYGELAAHLGSPGSARAVGQALGSNPFPIIVPCHRVLAAGGKTGGFTAEGGVSTKLRILALEGVAPVAAAPAEEVDAYADAIAHLRRADTTLARTIDAIGACVIEQKSTSSTFSALAEAIVYQQLNGRAAETIFNRVCALMPRTRSGFQPEDLLKLDDEPLRGAGLSKAKLLALQDLSRRAVAGEIPPVAKLRTMDDESIIQQLTAVRGIGRWTVEMLLMFRLGRLDVLPLDDFGIRAGYAAAFGKAEQPSRKALAEHGERWKPYRSIASWYLWRALERARRGDA